MLFNHYLPFSEFRPFQIRVERPLTQVEISQIKFGNIQQTEKWMISRWLENPRIFGDYYFDIPFVKLDQIERIKEEITLNPKLVKPFLLHVECVIETPKEFWILDFKAFPEPSDINQILQYEDLFTLQYKPEKDVKLGVVLPLHRPEPETKFRQGGIEVFLPKEIKW